MIGARVGHFEITAKLGEGGMGAVWRARDTLLERDVAIKFLSDALAESQEARQRLLNEARTASRLHHPSIATVFEVGESDGLMYIAQLLVEGETLAAALLRGGIHPARAVVLTTQVAAALGHAHSRGVLHRDISCRNIMLDEESRAVVVDFGLARVQEGAGVTRPGTVMGTATYIAPEVAAGQPADHRSDLYSLGAVLYEMLTGQPPFIGENTAAVLYAAVHTPPKPVRELAPAISAELEQVVMRLLEKSPSARFATARELCSALQAVPELEEASTWDQQTLSMALETLPSDLPGQEPMPGTSPTRSARPRTVSSRVAGAALLLLTAVVVALVVEWNPFHRDSRIQSVAVIPFQLTGEDAMQDAFLVEGIASHLTSQLTHLESIRVTPWVTSRRFLPDAESLEKIAGELHVDALIVGTIGRSEGRLAGSIALVDARTNTQEWSTEFNKPVTDLFELQEEVALLAATRLIGKLTNTERQDLARPAAKNLEAYEHYLRGATLLALGRRQTNEQALSYFQRAIDLDPSITDAYAGMSNVYLDRVFYGWEGGWGNLALAENSLQSALERDPTNMNALSGVVRLRWHRGDPSRRILEVGEQVRAMGRDDPSALSVRAKAYLLAGLSDRSGPLFQRILQLDPANTEAAWFLTVAQSWMGHASEAVETGRRFLTSFGEDPEIHVWIGMAYLALGETGHAETHLRRAIQIFGDQSNLYVFYHYAGLLQRVGRDEEARTAIEDGLSQCHERLVRFPDNLRLIQLRIAGTAMLGDRDQAWREIQPYLVEDMMPPTLIGDLARFFLVAGDLDHAAELARIACERGAYIWAVVESEGPGSSHLRLQGDASAALREAILCHERLGQQLRSEF